MQPKFTAKDYNFVAKRIREHFPIWLEGEDSDWFRQQRDKIMLQRGVLTDLAIEFAKSYKKDNERFDPIHFLDACSPDVDRFPLSELWEDDK